MWRGILILAAFLSALKPAFSSEPSIPPTTRPSFEHVIFGIAESRPFTDQAAVLHWLGLTDKPTPPIEAAFARLRSNLEQLHIKRADELPALAENEQKIQRQVKLLGGNLDPNLIMAILQEHEGFHRDTLAILREHRRALRSILPPARHARLESLPIHQYLMRWGLQNVTLSPEQTRNLDGLLESIGTRLVEMGHEPPQPEVERLEEVAMKLCAERILTPEQRKQLGWPWVPMEQLLPVKRPAGE